MPSFNSVTLVGYLTRDPELKRFEWGDVCNFGLAINRKFKTSDGEEKEEVSFIDCVIIGKLAENASNWMAKGLCVLVHGELKQERWETDGGDKRSRIVVRVSQYRMITFRDRDDAAGENQPEGGPLKPKASKKSKPFAPKDDSPYNYPAPDDDDIPF